MLLYFQYGNQLMSGRVTIIAPSCNRLYQSNHHTSHYANPYCALKSFYRISCSYISSPHHASYGRCSFSAPCPWDPLSRQNSLPPRIQSLLRFPLPFFRLPKFHMHLILFLGFLPPLYLLRGSIFCILSPSRNGKAHFCRAFLAFRREEEGFQILFSAYYSLPARFFLSSE